MPAIEALGSAPEALAKVIPYSTVTEVEAALLHALRTRLHGLPPSVLESQLLPAFELATRCAAYATKAQFRPGFSNSLLRQAISEAATLHRDTSTECLAICALEAVKDCAMAQL